MWPACCRLKIAYAFLMLGGSGATHKGVMLLEQPDDEQFPPECIEALFALQEATRHNDIQQILRLGRTVLGNEALTPALRVKVMVLVGNKYGDCGMLEESSTILDRALTLALTSGCPADLTIAAGMSAILAYHAMGSDQKAKTILERLREVVSQSHALELGAGHNRNGTINGTHVPLKHQGF